MAKQNLRIQHGDILSIPIFDIGYVYAKYINVTKLNTSCPYPDVLRVYSEIHTNSEHINHINKNLLLPPFAIAGSSGIIKNLKWKVVGNEVVEEYEEILPDVKMGHPHFLYGYDESKYEKWLYIEELGSTQKQYFADYENVKHLAWDEAIAVDMVPFRILIEHFKINGVDVYDKFKELDWIQTQVYAASINQPIYSQLNPKTRDFVLNK